MDRLAWAIELIEEALNEKRYAKAMQAELDKISIYDPDFWKKHAELSQRFTRVADNALIKNNLKMARRILRDECM